MKLLFCSDPLQARKTDSAYEPEASAASALNIPYFLIDFEALVN